MEEEMKSPSENEFRWELENFSELKKQYPFAEKKYITSKNFFLPPHFEWYSFSRFINIIFRMKEYTSNEINMILMI